MNLLIVLIVVLLLVGGLPVWPYSAGWGYYPVGGGLGFIILIVIVLALLGRL